MDKLYLTSIEADVVVIESASINIKEVYNVAYSILGEDVDVACSALEAWDGYTTHPALELSMSDVKEGFKKAIEKIIEFFKFIGKKITDFFNKIVNFFKKVLGIKKKEEIKKEVDKTKKKAEEVKEKIDKSSKEELEEIKSKVVEVLDEKDKEIINNIINRAPAMFIAENKLDEGTIDAYVTRVYNQHVLLTNFGKRYSSFSNDYLADLDDTIKQIASLISDLSNDRIESVIAKKAPSVIGNVSRNMKALYDRADEFYTAYNHLRKNEDRYIKAVKSYVNAKEEGIYVIVGNKFRIFSIKDVNIEELYNIYEKVKTTKVDVENLPMILGYIEDFYSKILESLLSFNKYEYTIKLKDPTKALKMIKLYIVKGYEWAKIIDILARIDKLADDSINPKDLEKAFELNVILLKRDTHDLSRYLEDVVKKVNDSDYKELSGALNRLLRISNLLTKAYPRIINIISAIIKTLTDNINDSRAMINILFESFMIHLEVIE